MATLLIESWSEDGKWAGESGWRLSTFCDRLRMCTALHGTELKRTARSLMKKQLKELEGVNAENANALIHTLESLGANVVLK
ncbi:hypothetical protein [Microbulbifer donghaiensis]|uniref:hypothetical protein n=1 Tax=Microbulbifer donghaiensis TaxID=494016 RepID=UPI0011614000|nr:hypothetical protein [Microbulbifer donghaiensis]